MSQSSIDETYPTSLPCSKYWFKKIASKVFRRNPWKTNVQRDTDSETLPDLTLPVPTGNVQPKASCTEGIYMPVNVDFNLTVPIANQTVQHNNTSTECLNIPLHVDYTHSETITNPSPINIQPHSDLNVTEEEECASTDI